MAERCLNHLKMVTRIQSLNYVNMDNIDEYQKGKAGIKEGEEIEE